MHKTIPVYLLHWHTTGRWWRETAQDPKIRSKHPSMFQISFLTISYFHKKIIIKKARLQQNATLLLVSKQKSPEKSALDEQLVPLPVKITGGEDGVDKIALVIMTEFSFGGNIQIT